MKWMTIEEVNKAAQGTELEAAQCSLKHWQQVKNASFEELRNGVGNGLVSIFLNFCALCVRADGDCNEGENCCLPYCSKNRDSTWKKARNAFNAFKKEKGSRELAAKFQDCAADMCDVIETAIRNLVEAATDKPKELSKDDLARNSKSLEQFRLIPTGCHYSGFKAKITGVAGFAIGNIDNTWQYNFNEATEIHQKLGQLLAEAKRRKENS